MKNIWNKIKELFSKTRDLQYVGTANIVTKAIAGLFWFYVATLMAVEAYGEISYFIAIATMATRLSLFGSSQTIIVYTAKKIAIQPPVFFIALILGTISSIILYFIFNNFTLSMYTIGALIFDLGIASMLGAKLYKNYLRYFITQKILAVTV